MHRKVNRLLWVVSVATLAPLAWAQVSSRISGTIQDVSGAVIPGVRVVVTDVNRGVTQSTVANEVGRYVFPSLGVGQYVVTAEKEGFKKATSAPFRLEVNQVIEINIPMQVGDVAEQVEVTSTTPLLQTSESRVGTVVENKQFTDLPLAARDFMQMALIVTGVVESSDNSRHQAERATWQGSFSVHGISADYNQYLFDGLAGKEVQHETNIFAPSVDAIAEMRMETSNYSAEFGSEAGGHLNIVTKSGTNSFHGTLFEFLRNTKLDAREKFADRRPQENRNTFGATLGGPILRDRTFFFFSWQHLTLRQGFTQNTTVPTPAFRQGDFSALLNTDSSNPTPITLYDWTSRQPFPSNRIPATRIHPLSQRFMDEYVPLPIRAGRGGIRPIDNYQSLEPQETETPQYLGRIDHTFSEKSRIYGRYIYEDTSTIAPPVWPKFTYEHAFRGQHAVLNYSRTLSPTTLFELRTGYSRFRQNEFTESAFVRDTAAALGLKGACAQPACWHAPYWTITDYSVWGNNPGRTRGSSVEGPRGWKNEIFQAHGSLYWTRRSHTTKVGFTAYRHRDTFPNGLTPAGRHGFNGQWTQGPNSPGYALADTLLGAPRSIFASIDIVDPNYRNSHLMPWIQDDWKVTPKLTLNLGLRYEWMGRPYSNRDRIGNWYRTGPNTATIITPRQEPNSPFTQVKPDTLGRSLLQNDNNNFAPRLGFAYRLDDKTVLRGAYGLFYQRDTMDYWILIAFNPPFNRQGSVTLGANERDFGAFPIDDLTPVVNFVNPASRPAPYGKSLDWKEAYVQQWNFFIERSLARDFVLKAGYVGNHAVGLPRDFYPNEPRPAAGDVQARRPFQEHSSVLVRQTDGHSSYSGLELQAEKRYSAGLSFVTGYTWSKVFDNQTFLDLWFGGNNRGLSRLHVGHRFSFNGIWEVPFGRARRFGTDVSPVVDGILGGWQLSGSLVFRTGIPLTAGFVGDAANTGGISQVPIRLAEPNLPRGDRTESRFFNTGVFATPAPYTLGNAGVRTLAGPGFRNLDLSVAKVFGIREGHSLQLRGEFFNAFNHPNMGDPGMTLGSAAFGRVTSTSAFGTPRVVQVGLKYLF